MTSITVKNLGHIFQRPTIKDLSSERRISALNSITFDLMENSITLIIGPSGSGKSTLFNILATSFVPTVGMVKFDDIEPFTLEKDHIQLLRWDIGYFRQNLEKNFFSELTFDQNLEIIFYEKDMYQEIKNKILPLLRKLNLDERHLYIPIKLLSGGEKQRLALLKLLLKDPDLFILDEPTSFLDESNKQVILSMVQELKDEGKTIIIASHDEEFIKISDKFYVIEDGKISKDDNLPKISSFLTDKLSIEGKNPNDDYLLPIPNSIFENLAKEAIYLLKQEKISKKSLVFIKLDREEFDNKQQDNWIFLDTDTFKVPETLRSFPWQTSKIFWKIEEKYIEISFQDSKEE